MLFWNGFCNFVNLWYDKSVMGNSMENPTDAYKKQVENAQKITADRENEYKSWLKQFMEKAKEIQKGYKEEEGLEK